MLYEFVEKNPKARLLTVQQAKYYLNVGINQMYKLCRRSDFPVVMMGNKKYVDFYKLNIWLDKQSVNYDIQNLEDWCEYYRLGDLWMCQFCENKCSRAGKVFGDE